MENRFSTYMTESLKLSNGPPASYKLKLKIVNLDGESDENSKLRKFTLGKRDPDLPNKSILLVGATGSGKSTLINALVNYVMGVKYEDKVWFEVITGDGDKSQTESQTSAVSVYEIFGFKKVVPFSLTIIDTPGYGDTRGVNYDEITTRKLLQLFKVPDEADAVKTLDAVGLVVKSTENRLDDRIAYIFNSVTSLFGKDMEKNIVAMITHSPADGKKPQNVLNALEEANITFAKDEDNEPVYFRFNNNQKETTQKGKKAEKDAKRAFESTEDGMEEFTDFLEKCQPQSLQETRDVLEEREILTACIDNFQEHVTHIEKQQEAIEKNKQVVENLKQEIPNMKTKVKKTETYKVRERCNTKALSCISCEETCHKECTWAIFKSWCEVLKGGECTVCSGKCDKSEHAREKWRYVSKNRVVEVEVKDLHNMNKAEGEIKDLKTLLKNLQEKLEQLQRDKDKYLDDAYEAIEKLENIALNADSVSTYGHLDFLITKMKERGDREKVQKLEGKRKKIETRSKGAAEYFVQCYKKAKCYF